MIFVWVVLAVLLVAIVIGGSGRRDRLSGRGHRGEGRTPHKTLRGKGARDKRGRGRH